MHCKIFIDVHQTHNAMARRTNENKLTFTTFDETVKQVKERGCINDCNIHLSRIGIKVADIVLSSSSYVVTFEKLSYAHYIGS